MFAGKGLAGEAESVAVRSKLAAVFDAAVDACGALHTVVPTATGTSLTFPDVCPAHGAVYSARRYEFGTIDLHKLRIIASEA